MFVVVTVFAVWLGWELKFIRERQACLRRLADDPENLVILSTGFEERGTDHVTYLALSEPVTIPIWRRVISPLPIPRLIPRNWATFLGRR
jgi:hypothetical protein